MRRLLPALLALALCGAREPGALSPAQQDHLRELGLDLSLVDPGARAGLSALFRDGAQPGAEATQVRRIRAQQDRLRAWRKPGVMDAEYLEYRAGLRPGARQMDRSEFVNARLGEMQGVVPEEAVNDLRLRLPKVPVVTANAPGFSAGAAPRDSDAIGSDGAARPTDRRPVAPAPPPLNSRPTPTPQAPPPSGSEDWLRDYWCRVFRCAPAR